MKHKPVFVILFILIATGMIVFANLELMASPTSHLTTILISNHEETERGDYISYVDGKSGQSAAHVAWAEATSTTHPYDDDIFYRRLPNGVTINLSDKAETQGNAGPVFVQPALGNDVCVLWREMNTLGDYHLYLWRSVSDTINISPNPVDGSSSYTTFTQFTCNASQDAQIIWEDSSKEIFIWDEAQNTQTRLSQGSSTVLRGSLQHIVIDNKIYLLWIEGAAYYWDSINETTQQITTSTSQAQMFGDKVI